MRTVLILTNRLTKAPYRIPIKGLERTLELKMVVAVIAGLLLFTFIALIPFLLINIPIYFMMVWISIGGFLGYQSTVWSPRNEGWREFIRTILSVSKSRKLGRKHYKSHAKKRIILFYEGVPMPPPSMTPIVVEVDSTKPI